MKHSLMDEYHKADLKGKNILQPTIDELCKIQAKGRTFIRIKELLDELDFLDKLEKEGSASPTDSK